MDVTIKEALEVVDKFRDALNNNQKMPVFSVNPR